MTGVRVAERMGRNALGDAGTRGGLFDGTLDVGFVKVIAAHFAGLGQEGKLGGREEPLPDVIAGGVFVFLLELPRQEGASVTFSEILGVEAADILHLLSNLRQGTTGQGYSSIFLAFPVMDRKEHGVKIEAMDAQIAAAEAANCRGCSTTPARTKFVI